MRTHPLHQRSRLSQLARLRRSEAPAGAGTGPQTVRRRHAGRFDRLSRALTADPTRAARLAVVREVVQGVGILALVIVPAYYAGLAAPNRESVTLGAARQVQPETAAPPVAGNLMVQPAAASLPLLRRVPLVRINAPAAPDAMIQPQPVELALLAHVNADRAQHDLRPVEFEPALLPLARARATDQISRTSLSHFDAFGKLAFGGLLSEAPLRFSLAGENLARLADGPEVAGVAERALMNSPTHRKNILEPSFNRLAVGITDPRDGKIALAQLFLAVPDPGEPNAVRP